MSSSVVPYNLEILKSHIEVTFHPSITDESWSELNELGDTVSEEIDNRNQPDCIIDLSELTYMGSSVVALIVRLWKKVKSNRGRMVLVVDHPLVKEIIALAGLDKIWSIYPHVNLARKAIGAPINIDSSGSTEKMKSVRVILLLLLFVAIAGIGVACFLYQSK